MEWYDWIWILICTFVLSIFLKKMIKYNSLQKLDLDNVPFYINGKFYRIMTEDRAQSLESQEHILNSYLKSWMFSMEIDRTKKHPDWLVNDFADIVYQALCSDDSPEDSSQHWEGWIANRLGIIHAKILANELENR